MFSRLLMDFCFLRRDSSNYFLSLIRSDLSFSICSSLGSIAFFISVPNSDYLYLCKREYVSFSADLLSFTRTLRCVAAWHWGYLTSSCTQWSYLWAFPVLIPALFLVSFYPHIFANFWPALRLFDLAVLHDPFSAYSDVRTTIAERLQFPIWSGAFYFVFLESRLPLLPQSGEASLRRHWWPFRIPSWRKSKSSQTL